MLFICDVVHEKLNADRTQRWRKMSAVLLAACAGLALFAYAWAQRDKPFFPPKLPFDTGWIFQGYYNGGTNSYVEGPNAAIMSGAQGDSDLPKVGDVLRAGGELRVRLVDFRTAGTSKWDIPPPKEHAELLAVDETGATFPKGSLLFVRDVFAFSAPDKEADAIWARVVGCNASIPQCVAALSHRK